jgi:hypothetical protein
VFALWSQRFAAVSVVAALMAGCAQQSAQRAAYEDDPEFKQCVAQRGYQPCHEAAELVVARFGYHPEASGTAVVGDCRLPDQSTIVMRPDSCAKMGGTFKR